MEDRSFIREITSEPREEEVKATKESDTDTDIQTDDENYENPRKKLLVKKKSKQKKIKKEKVSDLNTMRVTRT